MFAMTMFERFLTFTKGLSIERLEAVEGGLAALMESYSERHEFTEGELSKLDRRVADPAPKFTDPATIEGIRGAA